MNVRRISWQLNPDGEALTCAVMSWADYEELVECAAGVANLLVPPNRLRKRRREAGTETARAAA